MKNLTNNQTTELSSNDIIRMVTETKEEHNMMLLLKETVKQELLSEMRKMTDKIDTFYR